MADDSADLMMAETHAESDSATVATNPTSTRTQGHKIGWSVDPSLQHLNTEDELTYDEDGDHEESITDIAPAGASESTRSKSNAANDENAGAPRTPGTAGEHSGHKLDVIGTEITAIVRREEQEKEVAVEGTPDKDNSSGRVEAKMCRNAWKHLKKKQNTRK